MEQFEQLLTCAICLDRYRNPKLLPCQHSFCMEPCMDGLVDYVRRQVKCPECRAEHRIPYQGVQGYPTNVTLQRFLELHIEITGELPDPTSGQIMERCNVCSEKAYCSMCVHCDKKICGDCKGAHMDILRREITRINNQIRRALHRLQDMLAIVEKNMLNLKNNCSSVNEEVDEIYRRLTKALKDRTEYLRGEVDKYMSMEVRNLLTLKENLEVEISNIQSNCDLADKHMTEDVDWDDCELMDAKEIFLKTIEFIRNFECETTDYNRRVRFAMAHDPNQLVLHVAGYGELSINSPHQLANTAPGIMSSGSSTNLLQPPGPGLMRSKSDHRLTTQFRQQEERGYDRYGDDDSFGSKKFGERFNRSGQGSGNIAYNDRYGRQDYGSEFDSPYDSESRRSGFRSRFRRDRENDSDNDVVQTRSVRFSEPQHKERERVLDTEDVARGPLSGITRLYDSPRVMKRLAEIGKEKKKPEPKLEQQVAKFQPPKRAQRQISEEDEITRIKKMNKQGENTAEARGVGDRGQAIKRGGSKDREDRGTPREESTARKTPPVAEVPSSEGESEEEEEEEEEEQENLPSLQNKATKTAPATSNSGNSFRRSSISSDLQSVLKKSGRSASSDSTTSTESSHAGSGIKNTGAAFTTEEMKQKFLKRGSIDKGSDVGSGSSTPRGRLSSTGSDTTKKEPSSTPPKFQSRFLNRQQSEKPMPTKEEEEETESSSESETDSDDDSEEDKRQTASKEIDKTDIGPLLARSAQTRDSGITRRESRDDGTGYRSRYGQQSDSATSGRSSFIRQDKEEAAPRNRYSDDATRNRYGLKDEEPYSVRSRYGGIQDRDEPAGSRYLSRSRNTQDEEQPKYGSYTSRFLNKSKSTAAVSPDEDSDKPSFPVRKYSTSGIDDDGKYTGTRSRYSAIKDRQNRIARSRSSHTFGNPDEDDDEELSSPTAYLQSKYGPSSTNDLARSRSTHHLKSREASPDRPGPGSEKDGAALSSWARYLKNKYGNRGKDGKDSTGNSSVSSSGAGSSSVSSRRLSLGLPLRHNSASFESSDDDQKNMSGSPTSPTATAAAGFVAAAAGSTLRNQYLQKRRQLFKMGSRGSEPGNFTWPRGIAVGTDNSIVVADSSNHRVQVFDSNGNFLKEFGRYGNGEGEFDCLAGVAVNRIGQFIIADRYNHRIQVLDPSGRFLRAFGSQGTGDGRFNYPWGITTDALGFIYVCDKENHRVQVFQSDGTFVGKFGSHGSQSGQLEHPHYITVSNTNRVIVSDSNNHRVQIFDVNGRVLSSFGSEGSEEGQFKFPRKGGRDGVEEPTEKISHDEYYSCCSSNSGLEDNESFGKLLKGLDEDSFEDKVMNYLNSCQTCDNKNLPGKELAKHIPSRRHSDVSMEILSRADAILRTVAAKPKTEHHNSVIYETIPLGSLAYKHIEFRKSDGGVEAEGDAKPKGREKRSPPKRRALTVFDAGPDLSRILKPETLAILKESRQDVNFTTRSLLNSMRKGNSGLATAVKGAPPNTEGGSSRRSGIHFCGRFGEQQDSNLQSGRHIPSSVRLLGLGRRGIQGAGGSGSNEQWKYSGLRPREPSRPSILNHGSRVPTSHSFEYPKKLTAFSAGHRVDLGYSYRSDSQRGAPAIARYNFIQRPRSTIF